MPFYGLSVTKISQKFIYNIINNTCDRNTQTPLKQIGIRMTCNVLGAGVNCWLLPVLLIVSPVNF